jgi:peptidoglycan/xylan/chitin deacetylase (PgdA/CDA1 family)
MLRPRTLRSIAIALATLASLAPPGLAAARAPAPVIFAGSTAKRVIAITIDDGDSPQVCRSMARTLRQEHVPATFFPIGSNVARSPALWASIAGHFPIGNHTMHHIDLTRVPLARARREIRTQARTVERVTGAAGIPYLRPPYGAEDRDVRRLAGDLGYRALVLWSVTDADTATHSRESGMLRDALRGTNGSILLMHCNAPVAADLLPRIIAAYRAQGFGFVTIPQLLHR